MTCPKSHSSPPARPALKPMQHEPECGQVPLHSTACCGLGLVTFGGHLGLGALAAPGMLACPELLRWGSLDPVS